MTDLTHQIALITGASRGIGRAIALAFAHAGADIAVNYRTQAAAAAAVGAEITALGRRSLTVQADVSQAGEVARLVATVEQDLGPPSLLVNNAGLAQPRSLEALTEPDWDTAICSDLQSKQARPAIEGTFGPTLSATDGRSNRHYLQLNLQSTAPTCNRRAWTDIICN